MYHVVLQLCRFSVIMVVLKITQSDDQPRVDIAELKTKLLQKLSDSAPLYWECFKKFLRAKLSKAEFDAYVSAVLGDAHIPLHNRFVSALIYNAHCSSPPPLIGKATPKPPPVSKKKKSTRRTEVKKKAPIKKKVVKASLTSASRPTLVKLANEIKPEPETNTLVRPEKNSPAYQTTQGSSFDAQFASTPYMLALRRKMFKTTLEAGLRDLSNGCVLLMKEALYCHLKDIVSSCSPNARFGSSQAQESAPYLPCQQVYGYSHLEQFDQLQPPPTNVITTTDAVTAIQISSYLLRENLPINQERLSLLQATGPTQ